MGLRKSLWARFNAIPKYMRVSLYPLFIYFYWSIEEDAQFKSEDICMYLEVIFNIFKFLVGVFVKYFEKL
jgi:hypothetical protein